MQPCPARPPSPLVALAIAAALLAGCGATSTADPATGARLTPSVEATAAAAPPAPSTRVGPSATPDIAPSGPFRTSRVVLTDGAERVPVRVHVADTRDLRARGLMGRTSLAEGEGMVFVYADDHTGSYWMRDTLIPLSIAFAGADGVLHTIRDMEPCTASPCEQYGADAPYRTALEVPQGWFAEQGVTTGWRLEDVPAS